VPSKRGQQGEQAGGGAGLADATAALYAAEPGAFVSTRTLLVAEAKASGDAALADEIGRLRKPTAAAWAVNLTTRERPDQVVLLRDVGQRLRAAQARLDAAGLRDLRAEREVLVSSFLAGAAEVAEAAGRPLAPAVLEEVRGTLIAALASEEATEAVTSGHLTRALSYSGFGEVDLSEAVARTSSGAVLTVLGPGSAAQTRRAREGAAPEREEPARGTAREQARQKAQREPAQEEAPASRAAAAEARAQAIRRAKAELATASRRLERAAATAEKARRRATRARERVADLETELAQARDEHRAGEQAATEAARDRAAAEQARHTAQEHLDAAEAADAGETSGSD
jgi:DNA repair exonuclease SbcCD ATPase subunit